MSSQFVKQEEAGKWHCESPRTPMKPSNGAVEVSKVAASPPTANILWAPKRPRLIRRLNRDKIEPRRLFEEEEEDDEEIEGPVTPKRSRLPRGHLKQLQMAPKRPVGQNSKNPNIRPVRLFQSFDQGYISDESSQPGDGQPDLKPLDDSGVVV